MKDALQETFNWFVLARPNPTDKDFHSQLGCHMEEFREMLLQLVPTNDTTKQLIETTATCVNNLANHLKKTDIKAVSIPKKNAPLFLDSLLDQIVTGSGVAYTKGYDIIGGLIEVNRSNYSKFDENGNPILDPETKKVMKGPNYSPADLSKFV